MKFLGRVYFGREGTYAAFYNHHHDITLGMPPSLEGNAQRAAHVTYSFGNRKGSIDVFKLEQLPNKIPEARFSPPITSTNSGLSNEDSVNDIQFDVIEGMPLEIMGFARQDIFTYCGDNPAKEPRGPKTTFHKIWVPRTQLETRVVSRLLSGGKQEFIRSCGLDANLDFSDGCVTGFIPSPGASFDDKTFIGYSSNPFFECLDCYADSNHRNFAKTIWEFSEQQLQDELTGNCRLVTGSSKAHGRSVEVLRLGKRTETGSIYTRDKLLMTLEVCARTGTRVVMPTRFLEFDKQIAELLKKTNSTVIYSLYRDEFERGACAHGCNQEFRVEQARKYKESGANSLFYINFHPVFEPTQKELEIIGLARKIGMPFIQVLPRRIYTPELMSRITGIPFDIATEKTPSMIDKDDFAVAGSYYREGKQRRIAIPQKIHPAWQRLISDNHGFVRMCHHNLDLVWCASCGLHDGFVIPSEHSTPKRSYKKLKYQKTPRNQGKLPFGK